VTGYPKWEVVLASALSSAAVFHYTEKRVRGHVAICVLAAVIEAVMAIDLAAAKLTDPDLGDQVLSARRALRELERVRMIRFVDSNDEERQVVHPAEPVASEHPHRLWRRDLRLALTHRLSHSRSQFVGQKVHWRDLVSRTFRFEPPKSGPTSRVRRTMRRFCL